MPFAFMDGIRLSASLTAHAAVAMIAIMLESIWFLSRQNSMLVAPRPIPDLNEIHTFLDALRSLGPVLPVNSCL